MSDVHFDDICETQWHLNASELVGEVWQSATCCSIAKPCSAHLSRGTLGRDTDTDTLPALQTGGGSVSSGCDTPGSLAQEYHVFFLTELQHVAHV